MDELVREFLVESYEGIDQLDRDLVLLEEHPTDGDLLARIFRCIHTIKGTCGFLAFHKLEKITHTGENLLSLLRDRKLSLTPEITTALLHMVDAVRDVLENIETTQQEGDADYSALIAELNRLQSPDGGGPAPAKPAEREGAEAEAPVASDGEQAGESVTPPPESKAPPAAKPADPPKKESASSNAESKAPANLADTAIRVDVHLLDQLMNLVGELVLARNQILQHTASSDDTSFLATTQRLNLVTTELQGGVMKTRMQPIKTIWSKFPRVVRDLATACKKKVRVEMEGAGTELDKTIIEAIKDPLTHVIRNSVDHGIEGPEERAAAGKPEEGRLLLRAFHEGGQVNIEIIDDGDGVNVERVKQKAIDRGLITQEHAARMGDREAVNLVFRPGFSTAEKVTNVSGRGVGMDVVRTNIEKIGGTVDIQSVHGQGTTLRVKIPLTLAIIPALVVTDCGEQYAIPQVSLLELVRLEGEQVDSIEAIHGAHVYRLRGNILPLVYLDKELRLARQASEASAEESDEAKVVNIVVLQADDRQFGLVVEGVNDTEEIVVKPLGRQLKGMTAFAGATVRGDGKVALILDVMGLAQKARVVSEHQASAYEGDARDLDGDVSRETLLLFRVGDDSSMAMPLGLVARLEELPGDSVEQVGNQAVVQYRGEIMPLLRLNEFFGMSSSTEEGPLQVIVYSQNNRSVGLVVDRILDIVEEQISVERDVTRRGVKRSIVVHGKVTQVLDLEAIIGSVDPVLLEEVAVG